MWYMFDMKKYVILWLFAGIYAVSLSAQTAQKPFQSLYVWGFSPEHADIDTLQIESLYKSARKALADVQFSSGFTLLERVEAEVLYSQAKEEESFLQIANAGPQGKATLEKVVQATKADAVLLGKVSREPNGNLLMEMSISHLRTFQLIATEEVELTAAQVTDRVTRNKLLSDALLAMLARCGMTSGGTKPITSKTFDKPTGVWEGELGEAGVIEFGGNKLGGNYCFYSCTFSETNLSVNFAERSSEFELIYSERGLYGCQLPTEAPHRMVAVSKSFVYDEVSHKLTISYRQTEGTDFGYILTFTGMMKDNATAEGVLVIERPTVGLFKGYIMRMNMKLQKQE